MASYKVFCCKYRLERSSISAVSELEEAAFSFNFPNYGGVYDWYPSNVEDYDYPGSTFKFALAVTGGSWNLAGTIDIIGVVTFEEIL